MIAGLKREEINHIRRELSAWYERPIGKLLRQQERAQLERALSNLFGYHIVQVGCLSGDDLLVTSRISHHFLLDASCGSTRANVAMWAYPDAIPLASESVDVAVLPHTLEFDRDPHQILREVDRILIAEGHVVVLGFNPWSIWGLRSLLHRRGLTAPWCGDFLSITRIKDWMALLGYDVVAIQGFFYRPPFEHKGIMRKLKFMERAGKKLWPGGAACYTLVAKKRMTTITPIKPRWRAPRSLVRGLARPTTRSSSEDA